MTIEFDEMLELVNGYCNQSFIPGDIPKSLERIVEEMCKYAKKHDSNLTGQTIGGDTMSWSYAGKSLFQTFTDLLAPYKRLKSL